MRFFLILFLMTAVLSPVHADLQDTRFRVSGDQGLIWIGFDEQAHTVDMTETSSGLTMRVSGVSLESHTILPPDRSLVLVMHVAAQDNIAQFDIALAQQWTEVHAELRQGGVLITIGLVDGGAGFAPQMQTASPVLPLAPMDSSPVIEDEVVPETTDFNNELALARQAANTVEPDAYIPPSAGEQIVEEPAEIIGSCEAAAAAVELNPWDDTALADHASCLVDMGNIEQAALIYEQMLAFEPENFDFAMALADIRANQGDMAAARALYDQATMNSMSDAEAIRARSQARAIQDQ